MSVNNDVSPSTSPSEVIMMDDRPSTDTSSTQHERRRQDDDNVTSLPPPLPHGVHRIHDYGELMRGYVPEKNRTLPVMTRFERAKVLGLRTEQLARGAEPMIEGDWTSMLSSPMSSPSYSPSAIAMEELNAKKTPYIIVRSLPDGSKDMWKIKDMIVLP